MKANDTLTKTPVDIIRCLHRITTKLAKAADDLTTLAHEEIRICNETWSKESEINQGLAEFFSAVNDLQDKI